MRPLPVLPLLLALSACTNVGPVEPLPPNRAPGDPLRVAMRQENRAPFFDINTVPAEREAILAEQRSRGQRLNAAGLDGVPEAWCHLILDPWSDDANLLGAQAAALERLAEAGPDHAWFAEPIGGFWRALLTNGAEPSIPERNRAVLERYGPTLRRLAERCGESTSRAAAQGLLGRLLVEGYQAQPNARAHLSEGARHLRQALADDVRLPSGLGLRAVDSAAVRRELEALWIAVEGRGQGGPLAPLEVRAADGSVQRTDDLLAGRPALVVVWGFD